MTQRNAARRRRADGELGEEEELGRLRKPKQHYLMGIYAPKPAHFNQVWPTVRTETFVEMVFGSIQKQGPCTREAILEDTELKENTIGLALADLMLWRKSVGTITDEIEGTRFFFVK